MLSWLGPWADWAWYYVAIGLFLVLSLAEAVRPARDPAIPVAGRWFTNLGLHAASAVILTILVPSALADAALHAAGLDWQPFERFTLLVGDISALIVGILLLDAYGYGMHRVQHSVFTLWRLHAVHHADAEMDTSTTLRHHPIEVMVSTGIGVLLFGLLGMPEWIVQLYALGGISISLVQHMNFGQPGVVDRTLQWVFVTPGMHRVHHSADARDHDANYGTMFSIWDRTFRTYRAEPALGQSGLRYGVAGFTDARWAAPQWGLLLPLRIRKDSGPGSLPVANGGSANAGAD